MAMAMAKAKAQAKAKAKVKAKAMAKAMAKAKAMAMAEPNFGPNLSKKKKRFLLNGFGGSSILEYSMMGYPLNIQGFIQKQVQNIPKIYEKCNQHIHQILGKSWKLGVDVTGTPQAP